MTDTELAGLAASIRELLSRIPASVDALPVRQLKALREELATVSSELTLRIRGLDPVRQPESFFDPADPRLFATFAAVALIGQERVPLASVEKQRFYGSGIYALYYKGPNPLYAPIASTEHPIYVGKAEPEERYAKTPQNQGTTLCVRLNEHRKNIAKATASLRLEDFECRFLIVASGWQAAAEAALISLFRPVWNKETKLIQGFGKHGDSADTRQHPRSPWDVLHTGRQWAEARGDDKKTVDEIFREVKEHFRRHAVVRDLEHVLQALLGHIKVQ